MNASDRAARWLRRPQQPAAGATPSPELGEREHQPHQVRLPRDGLLLVDLLQVPVDGAFRVSRRLGHVADALAFRQPDRHLTFRWRQLQGRRHQVGIDTMLAFRLDNQHQRGDGPRAVKSASRLRSSAFIPRSKGPHRPILRAAFPAGHATASVFVAGLGGQTGFARVSAVLGMTAAGLLPAGRPRLAPLHEKRGGTAARQSRSHHRAAAARDAYLEAGGLKGAGEALFQSVDRAGERLTGRPLTRRVVLAMDPFVGSGTSLLEAERLGFPACGSEFNPAAATAT